MCAIFRFLLRATLASTLKFFYFYLFLAQFLFYRCSIVLLCGVDCLQVFVSLLSQATFNVYQLLFGSKMNFIQRNCLNTFLYFFVIGTLSSVSQTYMSILLCWGSLNPFHDSMIDYFHKRISPFRSIDCVAIWLSLFATHAKHLLDTFMSNLLNKNLLVSIFVIFCHFL